MTCKLYVVTSGTHIFCLFKSSCSEPSETQERGTQKFWSHFAIWGKGQEFPCHSLFTLVLAVDYSVSITLSIYIVYMAAINLVLHFLSSVATF